MKLLNFFYKKFRKTRLGFQVHYCYLGMLWSIIAPQILSCSTPYQDVTNTHTKIWENGGTTGWEKQLGDKFSFL